MLFPDKFDLVIIGAGIMGVNALYQITERQPTWRVLLIDRSLIGSGTTQYSLGMHYPYGTTDLRIKLSLESQTLWTTLKTKIPDLPMQTLPFYPLFNKKNLDVILPRFIDGAIENANAETIKKITMDYPWLLVKPFQTLLTGCSGSLSKTQALTQKIADYLKQHHAVKIYEGIEVNAFHTIANEWELRTSVNESIRTKRVLLTLGPWITTGIWQEIAQRLDIRTKKIVSLHFDKLSTPLKALFYFIESEAFLMPSFDGNQQILSITSKEWDVLPNISSLIISANEQALGLTIMQRHCPSLIEKYAGGRVFCDAYGPALNPVITAMPDMPNWIIASGGSGIGFRLAPAIIKRALDLFKE